MKKIFTIAALFLLSAGMFAQDVNKATVEGQAAAAQNAAGDLKAIDTGEKAWKFDGVVGLNAAATGLVNWAAGGNNNVNGVAYAKLHLLYHKDAIAWETNFDTDFGLSYIDQPEDPFQKSSDNIKLATKFGWEFKENWYLTALGSFQSQYALGRSYEAGYNPAISKWLAPSYTDISVGIDWKKSVNGADFSVYLSPIAGRISTAWVSNAMNTKINNEYAAEFGALGAYDFRNDLQQRYGTYTYDKTSGDKIYRDFRAEFGLSLKGSIAYKYENLTLNTTLGLFTPYQGKGFSLKNIYEDTYGAGSWESRDVAANYFEYSNNNRQFGHFDVDWDVAISYQFLKVLNVTLSTSMKYYPGVLIADKNGDVKERLQFKSVLGLGIGYSF
ncbi:MAG: DUF3078 domain-containing protein [Paludibacteraceae bacterium]|nr:DUF3078 domain-containing protein [Paludibacteraceae bacterium]